MIRTSLAALALAGLVGTASAADLTAVQTVEKVLQVTNEDGSVTETLIEAETVAPGDTVVYTLEYANDGSETAEGVVLTMPVPEQVVLLEGSEIIRDTRVSYSIDGGANFARRENLFVGDGDETRPATADDITHMRWQFQRGIESGQTGEISFRGVLK